MKELSVVPMKKTGSSSMWKEKGVNNNTKKTMTPSNGIYNSSNGRGDVEDRTRKDEAKKVLQAVII